MYAAYAFGRSLAAPLNAWAHATAAFWSQTPFGQVAAAASELVERATRRYPKIPFATLVPDHDVYLTDWIDARLVPPAAGGFDLDDYVDLVRRFLGVVGPGAHVVAVCQPCVPVLAAVALMAEDGDAALPQSMALMG